MVSTSNDGIMTEYLMKYGALRMSLKDRPADLLETLYMTDCYRAGQDLATARLAYDKTIWNGVSSDDLRNRLENLATFMAALARDRAVMWGVELPA
jgi:hypothetical protein